MSKIDIRSETGDQTQLFHNPSDPCYMVSAHLGCAQAHVRAGFGDYIDPEPLESAEGLICQICRKY